MGGGKKGSNAATGGHLQYNPHRIRRREKGDVDAIRPSRQMELIANPNLRKVQKENTGQIPRGRRTKRKKTGTALTARAEFSRHRYNATPKRKRKRASAHAPLNRKKEKIGREPSIPDLSG